ncbi:NADH-quinone oxidoreductase subunit NuoE [Candidatus Bipolaricaulota bacterium]|nr:NADH-quinone oxidoreductase subunit NuoE [Candidatus Bipolaricaulota bacterium]
MPQVNEELRKMQNTYEKILEDLPETRESVIPALQLVQKSRGYLPEDGLEFISNYTETPLAKVYGIATFYSQFYLEPQGEHTVKVCQGTACHIKGANEIYDALLGELGIAPGEVTPDGKFTLTTVRCLGACSLAPVMMVDEDIHGNLTPDKARGILGDYE